MSMVPWWRGTSVGALEVLEEMENGFWSRIPMISSVALAVVQSGF